MERGKRLACAVAAVGGVVVACGSTPPRPDRLPACDPVGCESGSEDDECGGRCPDSERDPEPPARGDPTEPPGSPPTPPQPVPTAGDSGCVPRETVVAYEQMLREHADRELERAMEHRGATLVDRAGFLLRNSPDKPLGEAYTVDGRRFVVVGSLSSMAQPTTRLAKTPEGTLHMVHPNARSHQLQVTVCGPNPCVYGRGARVQALPLVIELEAGESMGEPLRPAYDTWWVFSSYTEHRDCGPPPA